MSKKKKIALFITLPLVAVVICAVLYYYFGASYPQFYDISTKEFAIPGLDTKFVPQGLEYDQNSNNFIVTGYMSNGEPSRFYIVDNETGKTEKYFTLTVDGKAYVGHAGGIAVDGDYAWVVGDKQVYRFSFAEALNTQNGKSLQVIDGFTPGNGADFALIYNNNLIVGEFYKEGKYDTPTSHHIKTAAGHTNYALSYIYAIDQSSSYGLVCDLEQNPIVQAGISMPNQVQGMTFSKDGNIVLSTSYSIPSSQLLMYQNVLNETPQKSANIDGKTIGVYELNNNNLLKTLKAPAMSEEVVLVNNRVYVLFESNCSKYRLVNRTRLSNVFAIDF